MKLAKKSRYFTSVIPPSTIDDGSICFCCQNCKQVLNSALLSHTGREVDKFHEIFCSNGASATLPVGSSSRPLFRKAKWKRGKAMYMPLALPLMPRGNWFPWVASSRLTG